MIEDSNRYSPDRVKALPKDVLQKASIKSISRRGFRYVENDITKAKMERAFARKRNKRIKTLSFKEYQDIANRSVVDNDVAFKYLSPEEIERRNDIERYAQYGFWNSLRMKDGFKTELKHCLQGFWRNEMESLPKSKILILLDRYLKTIHNIVSLKVVRVKAGETFDFTSDEIDSFDNIRRLSKFVTPSNYLARTRQSQSRKKKTDAIKDISAHFSLDFSQTICSTNINTKESKALKIDSCKDSHESHGFNSRTINVDRKRKGIISTDCRRKSVRITNRTTRVKQKGIVHNGIQKRVDRKDISTTKNIFKQPDHTPIELLSDENDHIETYRIIQEIIDNDHDNNDDVLFPSKISVDSKREMMNMVKIHDSRYSCMKVTDIRSPSRRQEHVQKELSIYRKNLERLMLPNEYIDDEIIDGYMALLDKRQIEYSDEIEDKCLFITTLWVPKYFNLTAPNEEPKLENIMFENVADWYDHLGDIFEYNKLFFPINIKNNHWALVVVYVGERIVQYYDSKLNDGDLYVNAVMRYLEFKWAQKDRNNNLSFDNFPWQTIPNTLDVPNQGRTNHCGMFMCLIADRIALNMDYSELDSNILCLRGRWYIMACINNDSLIF